VKRPGVGCLVIIISLALVAYALDSLFNTASDAKDKLEQIHPETAKYTAEVEDWQQHERYLATGDYILLTGRGFVLVRLANQQERVILNEIEPYKFVLESEGRPEVKFINITAGDYCQFEVHPYLEAELSHKQKTYSWLAYIVIGLGVLMLLIGIGLMVGESKEEKKDEIKRRIGV